MCSELFKSLGDPAKIPRDRHLECVYGRVQRGYDYCTDAREVYSCLCSGAGSQPLRAETYGDHDVWITSDGNFVMSGSNLSHSWYVHAVTMSHEVWL
eukprot:7732905-Pyramimonas_sp.AAC.1